MNRLIPVSAWARAMSVVLLLAWLLISFSVAVSWSRPTSSTTVIICTPTATLALPTSSTRPLIVPFERLFKAAVSTYGKAGVYAERTSMDLFVVGSHEQLRQLYVDAFASLGLPRQEYIPAQHPFSRVDFEQHLVIGIFMGPRTQFGL